MTHDELLRRI